MTRVKYYRFNDDDDYYEDSGHLKSYPKRPDGVSFNMGRFIQETLEEPLLFKMDPEWGEEPMLIWGSEITLMDKELVSTLREAGVENLQTFEAAVENPYSKKDMHNYLAVNILGLVAAADIETSDIEVKGERPSIDGIMFHPIIDASLTKGALMFRMAESVMEIIVHEDIKKALEKKFPSLEFLDAF